MAILILSGWYFFSRCNSHEIQFYDSKEANQELLKGFLAKDHECGTLHTISLPVVTEVRKSDVQACVTQILSLDCATWALDDPMPSLCLLMQADF